MNGYGDQLLRAARLYPDRAAVVDGDRSLTFGQLAASSARLATGLRELGLRPGERVVDIGDNRLEVLEIDFALARGGNVRVSLPELAPFDHHLAMVRDCQPALLICGPGWEDYARELASQVTSVRALIVEGRATRLAEGEHRYADLLEISAGWRDRAFDGTEILSLRYTGGTTGAPKGVIRTHREQITAATSVLLDLYGFQEDDVVIHSTPLSHGANAFVLPAVMRGALQVIGPSFDADVTLALVERHRGTFTKVVPPTGIRSLVEARRRSPGRERDLTSLRMVVAGSASLPGAVLEEAQEVFGPVIGQTYGQTESPLGLVRLSPAQAASRRGPYGLYPTGRPYTLSDVAVRPSTGPLTCEPGVTGELVVRSAMPFNGYWQRAGSAADVDQWRATGDIGCFDAAGFLYLLGRSDDFVPLPDTALPLRVVEEALYNHPAVDEASAVLLHTGSTRVAAAVALRPGAQADEGALRSACAHLPAEAVPTRVVVVETLPKSPTGKILRRRVGELVDTGR